MLTTETPLTPAMQIDREKLLKRIEADAAAGFDGNEGAGYMPEFTIHHERLLLTVARVLRGQCRDILPSRMTPNDRADFEALNEALRPFDPAPAEPVNLAPIPPFIRRNP